MPLSIIMGVDFIKGLKLSTIYNQFCLALNVVVYKNNAGVLLKGKEGSVLGKVVCSKIAVTKICKGTASLFLQVEMRKSVKLLLLKWAKTVISEGGDGYSAGVISDCNQFLIGTGNKNFILDSTPTPTESLVKKLKNESSWETPMEPSDLVKKAVVKSVQGIEAKAFSSKTFKSLGEYKVYPENELSTGEQVRLSEATMMYQPVFGTSAGSRYFLVAASSDLKVAARWINGSLSLRVEGAISKHIEELMASGICAQSKAHFSVHMECDQMLAAKAVGSAIVGMGQDWVTPVPKFSIIANKGS